MHTRLQTTLSMAVGIWLAAGAAPLLAQSSYSETPLDAASYADGNLVGTVSDERGEPLDGVAVWVLGDTSAVALTDDRGRFRFSDLPPGPYLVRPQTLEGFRAVRGTLVRVSPRARTSHAIRLVRQEAPQVLAAGFGAQAVDGLTAIETEPYGDDHSERAWRLRHLPRGVLDSVTADAGAAAGAADDDGDSDPLAIVGKAVVAPARLASAVLDDIAEIPFSGELNLLTTSSFDRPQDLFMPNDAAPNGVAYLSLGAPTAGGDWHIKGALTEGDLSSWMLAGSFVRAAEAAHAYEAGVSYSMQHYAGGNAVALAAMPEGSRNAGSMYAYDHWRMGAVRLTYGAEYSRYDYLTSGGLLSPRAALAVSLGGGLHVRGAASVRRLAPGAEEFETQPMMGAWMPPERTFSSLAADGRFTDERVRHYEAAIEQALRSGFAVGVRAFSQRVDNQLVTVFGLSLPQTAQSDIGHYYTGTAGHVSTKGWTVSVSRQLVGFVRGSVDITEASADWTQVAAPGSAVARATPTLVRAKRERVRDLTTSVDAEVEQTRTRMVLLYRVSTSADRESDILPVSTGPRFDLRVEQALPVFRSTGTTWAMLVAVRNVFRDAAPDASVYDELFVVRPPKRVVGGLIVKF
ncbi:MAG: carboxypeptidase regulatory-like domain-containing protein [Acidimicrobiia bacterium]|nr:carboxypeptidase regulatory-like domain-containing protein [Acidimicrobiia bacterium]